MSAFNRSFISAMPTGAKMYNDSLANERAAEQLKIQQAGEARTAADYEHKVGLRTQTDALREQLVSPNKSNYGLSAPAQFAPQEISSAMPMAEQADAAAGLQVGGIGLTDGVKLGGAPGMSARAPLGSGAGLQPSQQLGIAPPAKAPVLTNNKTPERGAASEILAKMAIINGDHEGFARHKQASADFDYEDGFNGHMKTALSADDKQRDSLFSPLVGYLNDNSKQITMGDPDAKGFVDLAITTAGGKAKFEKLSRQDQAKLYAAHMMMETNPTKAMAVMQSVNKDLAAAIAADNSLYEGVTKTRNDTAGKRHTAEHQDATLAEQERYRKSMVGLHQQRITQDAKAQGDPAIRKAYTDTAIQMQALAPTPANEAKRAELLNNLEMLRLRFDASRGVLPNPDNFRTQKGGNGTGDGKFHKAEEAGTIGVVNGQRVKVLADGSYGHVDAEQAPMKWVGDNYPTMAKEFQGKVSLTPDGRGLFIGTQEDFERSGGRVTAFDYKNPGDMNELYKSLRTGAAGDRLADEQALSLQKSTAQGSPSYPPRATRGQVRYDQNGGAFATNTRLSGVPPSIYDGAAAWDQYRKEQGAGLRPPTR